MRSVLDRVSWPARRWVCDLLVGNHAYTRNVAPTMQMLPRQSNAPLWAYQTSGGYGLPTDAHRLMVFDFTRNRVFKPFDQEAS